VRLETREPRGAQTGGAPVERRLHHIRCARFDGGIDQTFGGTEHEQRQSLGSREIPDRVKDQTAGRIAKRQIGERDRRGLLPNQT
jgi:hypothetical protein